MHYCSMSELKSKSKIAWRFLKKIKHSIAILPSNFTSGYTPKRTKGRDLDTYLYTHVPSSIIYNRRTVEATRQKNG